MSNYANPLLVQWVGEWLEEARSRNSKGVQVYKKAYESLKANPIQFSHPSEAKQLTGFGDKLCARLTAKMEKFCQENNLPQSKQVSRSSQNKRDITASSDVPEENESEMRESQPKKSRKSKTYVPQYRSGGYGLILALATLCKDPPAYMTKQEAISLAQPHCDSSYTAPCDPTKLYTAWNSMKILTDKNLVHEKKGGTRKYSLTSTGWDCARSIQNYNDPTQIPENSLVHTSGKSTVENHAQGSDLTSQPTMESLKINQIPDFIPIGKETNSASDLPNFTPIILEPGSFSIEMVLDTREVRTIRDRDYVEKELINRGIKPLKRVMALGDVTWVAKIHDPTRLSNQSIEGGEIILDYIVERKRLDDLIASIKDKRFHEQKFRLGRSGVKNVIYLIEEISMSTEIYQKMDEAVQSVIAGMQAVNGFFVKITQKIDETIEYLASLSKALTEKYAKSLLHVIPTTVLTATNYLPLLAQKSKEEPGTEYHITYPAFSCLMSKSETLVLRDLFLKMLMCTKGVTGEKALEIQKRWKTPFELARAYRNIEMENISSEEIKKKQLQLISKNTSHLVGRKKIGQSLSATIYEIWGKS
ncbi:Crossover junction endonuclease MUS81 [Golovinomyces cichoracearum]|uniref:Crossover junction endonuclease MUS81 n=1 Tax=Golovinomyces cichoracearum TaxID=62708 RepID=A0A420HI71_9PEZI|nr:Crossover junction endonuclease MUS81 [Golovinomyces cichoracearum]